MRLSRKLSAAVLSVAMIVGAAGFAAATPADVVGEPCEDAVVYLMGLGVVQGYEDGTIRPEGTITRAEATKVIIVCKYGDEQAAFALTGESPFDDVPGGHWASGHIMLAKNDGIVEGHGDGSFGPDDPVTYAQFAKMLVEGAGLTGDEELDWPDNYVTVATAAGLVGAAPAFAANEPAPRGDCFIMTAHTVQSVEDPETGLTLAQSVFGEEPAVQVVNLTQETEHATLAEAIAAAEAGDVLEIPAGTVKGGVTIPESLEGLAIQGAGSSETTILGDVAVEVTPEDDWYTGPAGVSFEGLTISGSLTVFTEAVLADLVIECDLHAYPAGGAKINDVTVGGDLHVMGSEVNIAGLSVEGDAFIGGPHIGAEGLVFGGAVYGAALYDLQVLRAEGQPLLGDCHDYTQDLYLSFTVGEESDPLTGDIEAGRSVKLEVSGVGIHTGREWTVSLPDVLGASVQEIDDYRFELTLTVKEGQTLSAGTVVVVTAEDAVTRTSDECTVLAERSSTQPWWNLEFRNMAPVELGAVEPDAATSSVEAVPGPTDPAAGEEFKFTVTVLDSAGNPLPAGPPAVQWDSEVELSGEERGSGNAAGNWDILFIQQVETGVFEVTATYDAAEEIDFYVCVGGVWLEDFVTVDVQEP